MRFDRRIPTRYLAGAWVMGMVTLSSCAAADTSKAKSADTVTLAIPSWVGAEANVAVAEYLLEEELGVKVTTRQMDQPVAWDAMDGGEIDAVLEDWRGFPDKEKKYIKERKTVVAGGDLGVTGHIGWFVPKYFADEHPEVTNWKTLNQFTDQLRTAESGNKGQLLEGSPSYTTNDPAIIKNLGIDLKPVYAGSEAAQITQIRSSVEKKKPFISYWWTPQWLNAEIDLVEVSLPPYKEGCADDLKKVTCAYPDTPLQKYFNADFAKNGGDTAQFLKNFKWTTEDQNEVARMITADKLSPETAAKRWIDGNKDVWEQWIPGD
ncbi:ABC transporter substrate-binding protein [Streptomyces sp. 2A115]|uniref:ABC transporter substrate-binding protein n=1 Tax=Streptomyces sp. 2A115 TaxID=3457439 RepID=UPI003FD01BC5